MSESPGRIPPSDLDAEAAVLSAILLNHAMLDQVAFLEAKHFYADSNRRIYQAAQELRDEGRPIDVITVAGYLRDRERLQHVGGAAYLAQLADATPAAANITDYGKSIVGKWEVRQIIATTTVVLNEAYADYGNLEDWKQSVDERVFASTRSSSREDRLVILADATRETIGVIHERANRTGIVIPGVTTGLPTLDARLGGLEESKLYVVAARPGIGKTAAATGFALAAATQDPTHGVVFVSVEMPRRQISFRVLSQVSRIDSVKLQRGRLSPQEHKDLIEAQNKIAKLPIVIEDSSNHTMSSIRAAYRMGERKLQERFGKQIRVKLCAIDYLQLLNSHTETNNREQEIAHISRGCKALAKDEGIAVLSLAQVNRECEKRPDKRPMLSDLRESGAVEQDADCVMFIYRQDYYRPKDEEKDDRAEFGVSKLRDNGGPGVVHTRFDPKTTSFYEESRNPDLEQLGDMFDDYLPGTYGETKLTEPPAGWQDDYDK